MGFFSRSKTPPSEINAEQREFLSGRLEATQKLADALWRRLGLEEVSPQALHMLNVVTLGMLTHRDPLTPADAVIDLAADFADDDFRAFLQVSEVRAALRRLYADSRSGARRHDVRELTGLVQMALLRATDGPSGLPADAAQDVVGAAADVVSNSLTLALNYPSPK